MKKIFKLWLDTFLGPFAVWLAMFCALCATIVLGSLLGAFGRWLFPILLVFLTVATLAVAAAFFRSLWLRRWTRAVCQFLLGILCVPIFVAGCAASGIVGWFVAHDLAPEEASWRSCGTDGALPFSVAFRRSHPFLAEYDKRVVFKSGKTVAICMDPGGAGPCAVYRLPSGEYYLVDGLDFDWVRNDYRVNVSNETVEVLHGASWIRIPDETLELVGGSSDGIVIRTSDGQKSIEGGVPVGDMLAKRTYLGRIHQDGFFEAASGDGDSYAAAVDPPWTDCPLPSGVHFSLQRRQFRGSRRNRAVFKSGKGVWVGNDHSAIVGNLALYALSDEQWLLVESPNKKALRSDFRIDAVRETVEMRIGDSWVRIPDDTADIPSWRGNGDCVEFSIETTDGRDITVVQRETIPVAGTLSNCKYLGSILKDGTFSATAPDPLPDGPDRNDEDDDVPVF